MAIKQCSTSELSQLIDYWSNTGKTDLQNFMENAKEEDTYLFSCVVGTYEEPWIKAKPLLKDWIVYEGPWFFNHAHPERKNPSINLIILEKPKEKKDENTAL